MKTIAFIGLCITMTGFGIVLSYWYRSTEFYGISQRRSYQDIYGRKNWKKVLRIWAGKE